MKWPDERYRPSERKYEGTPQDLDYAQMCPRRVSTSGAIKFEGQSLFLSSALAGWSVGLKPITGDRLEVWFGRFLLGQVDVAASSFNRADSRHFLQFIQTAICPNKTANRTDRKASCRERGESEVVRG